MSVTRASFRDVLNTNRRISSKKISGNRLSLRRFPFPSGPSYIPTYIEDVFSTYLYAGNGGSQTITNGIDLSTKGGILWTKQRNSTGNHGIFDSVRGINKKLITNSSIAQTTDSYYSSWNTDGFSLNTSSAEVNGSGSTYASWTFRKQAKFFDVVTYTGDGVQGRSVSHNLGSAPGWMVVKRTDGIDNWRVYHRSLGGTKFMSLDTTAAAGTANTLWNDADPTSTVFYLGNDASVNGNGMSYVAYLFAHNAGGFGASGSDNVISCGSFTSSTSSDVNVNLGYEPQLIIAKLSSTAGGWFIVDNMRGMPVNAVDAVLQPNASGAEDNTNYNLFTPTATGFLATSAGSSLLWGNNQTVIYIAIRRGPMKTPTNGTSVYNAVTRAGAGATVSTFPGFPVDLSITQGRGGLRAWWFDKLRGPNIALSSNLTNAEVTRSNQLMSFNQNGVTFGVDTGGDVNSVGNNYVDWYFFRAPGFFDVVCYTGDGTNMTINHNLGAVPELMIVKRRSITGLWFVYSAGTTTPNNYYLRLEDTGAQVNAGAQVWNNTSTTFLAGTGLGISASTQTYVAYLFATVAGVSKVGSYTGTGTTLQVNCGFTAGARFVMIKRTDSTGDWYVWDTARGIIAGDDPYLLMNSTAAEVTNTDYVDTYSAGFEISSTAPAAINASGGTYLFLAIA